jgi:hypothetical protein
VAAATGAAAAEFGAAEFFLHESMRRRATRKRDGFLDLSFKICRGLAKLPQAQARVSRFLRTIQDKRRRRGGGNSQHIEH